MGKIDFELRSKSSQSSIGCVKQGVCGEIIHKSEPSALEDSSQLLGNVERWAVWRKKEEEESSFLPYWTKFPHELTPMYLGTFSYTPISRANADKKTLKVLSPASLPRPAARLPSLSLRSACRSRWLCVQPLRPNSP